MCPFAEAGVENRLELVKILLVEDVEQFLLRGVMDAPANLYYHRGHGHTMPASAFAEGLEKLLRLQAQIGPWCTNSLWLGTGVCDAYIRWIDLPVPQWHGYH